MTSNSAKVVAWQKANPEAYLAKQRAWHLQKHGLTLADYDAMLDNQGGVCAICKNPSYTKRLAVDHCHTTGRVRGLLCHTCNNLLGVFESRREEFDAYLKR